MTKRLLLTLALVAGTGAAVATAAIPDQPVRVSTATKISYSVSGTVPVADAQRARKGTVRASFVLPPTWKRSDRGGSATLRFEPRSSCRYTARITARLVEVPSSTTTRERTTTLVPGPVSATGERNSAAWRVGRVAGTDDVQAALVQPLPASNARNTPAGRRLFSEIVALADEENTPECHSGAPRSMADAFSAALGGGSAGGFSY